MHVVGHSWATIGVGCVRDRERNCEQYQMVTGLSTFQHGIFSRVSYVVHDLEGITLDELWHRAHGSKKCGNSRNGATPEDMSCFDKTNVPDQDQTNHFCRF